MARNYPKFLYSNPSNTKSVGPFIVHTLYPQGILTINGVVNGSGLLMKPTRSVIVTLKFDSLFHNDVDEDLISIVEDAASKWFNSQIEIGAIKFQL